MPSCILSQGVRGYRCLEQFRRNALAAAGDLRSPESEMFSCLRVDLLLDRLAEVLEKTRIYPADTFQLSRIRGLGVQPPRSKGSRLRVATHAHCQAIDVGRAFRCE